MYAVLLGVFSTYAVAWSATLLLPRSIKNQRVGTVGGRGFCWEVRQSDDLAWRLVQWSMNEAPPGVFGAAFSEWIEQRRALSMGRAQPLTTIPTWGRPNFAPDSPDLPPLGLITHEACGWPFLAVWSTATADPRFAATPLPGVPQRGLRPLTPEANRLASAAMFAGKPNPIVRLRGAFPSPIAGRAPHAVAGRSVLAWRPLWGGFVLNSAVFGAAWLTLLVGTKALTVASRRRRGRCLCCGYDLCHDFATGCSECGWNRTASAGEAR